MNYNPSLGRMETEDEMAARSKKLAEKQAKHDAYLEAQALAEKSALARKHAQLFARAGFSWLETKQALKLDGGRMEAAAKHSYDTANLQLDQKAFSVKDLTAALARDLAAMQSGEKCEMNYDVRDAKMLAETIKSINETYPAFFLEALEKILLALRKVAGDEKSDKRRKDAALLLVEVAGSLISDDSKTDH